MIIDMRGLLLKEKKVRPQGIRDTFLGNRSLRSRSNVISLTLPAWKVSEVHFRQAQDPSPCGHA